MFSFNLRAFVFVFSSYFFSSSSVPCKVMMMMMMMMSGNGGDVFGKATPLVFISCKTTTITKIYTNS